MSILIGAAAGYAGAQVAGTGVTILDNAIGRPLELWTRTAQASNEAEVRRAAQLGNRQYPTHPPAPDAILSAWRRGLIDPNVAAKLLTYQGVMPPWRMIEGMNAGERNALINRLGPNMGGANGAFWWGRVWDQVSYMAQSRPGPGDAAVLHYRGRIDNDEWLDLRHAIDADWGKYRIVARAQYQSPGAADLIALRRLGRIDDSGFDLWMRRIGWTNTDARNLQVGLSTIPSPQEALLANWRGIINGQELTTYLQAHGYLHDRDYLSFINANTPLPSPTDLVRFAVREVWDQPTVDRFGYDEEFPEPFAHWCGWWGLNWGQTFQGPDGRQYPSVTWPQAWWRAHWQIMSPEQAYRALHLLRPDQLQRYRELSPDVTPFTAADMARVLKVSDYPKPMRAWLQAIAFVPLRLVDLRNAYRFELYGQRTRAWAIDRLLDRGMVRTDAETTVDLWDRQNRQSSIQSIIQAQPRETYREIIAGYREGWLTEEDARGQLAILGFPLGFVDRALQLVDARAERESVSETLRLIRREFLGGALSYQETVAALRSIRLTGPVVERYLRRWLAQRTVARRALSTSQITALVASGALPLAQAALRLRNLGWTDPDLALILGQAEAKLLRTQAQQAAQIARQRNQSAKALLAAQKLAASAQLRAQAELRRITPLSTLRRWLQLGLRTANAVRSRLLAMGYDSNSADTYLSQWVIEYEGQQDSIPPAVANMEPLFKKQTPLSTVKRWYQRGIVTESWTIARMAALGYLPEETVRYLREWRDTIPKGATGPAPEPAVASPSAPATGPTAQGKVNVQTGTVNVPGTPGSIL